ncbi:Barwin-like endoglucanase [Trichophyton interdigitale]|nr:Barwin-like endoglucanase [Trichophyton interdigitale]KAG5217382.1 Barwin-like endoglucanase [Trichophyton interdigitale]KAG8205869.1 Barwin-like endoglucanase [Trichophyton interdigitale]
MAVKSFYALSLLAVCGIVSGLPAHIQNKVAQLAPTTTLDSTGRGTIYYQMGAAGSCGAVHGDGDYIVALGPNYMKGPNSPYCGRRISAKNTSNGKTVTVTVADTCPTCGPGDIDFALGPWNALTNNASPGVFPLSWYV